jgi:pimeloyl-ACP methyl ester carboxylesterase
MRDNTRPTIVLIHGAWHGPWCWENLRSCLHAAGWETTAPHLPSTPLAPTEPTPGLHDDIAALLDHVDHIEGPIAVVAHSYGGIPATELVALRPERVSHLVYVAAYLPQPGDSMYALHGIQIPQDITGMVPVPDDPIPMFYGDVDYATASTAAAQLRPQSLRSWTERAEHTDVSTTPTTYLLCENDQALPVLMQETFSARADAIERLDSGHSPFLSQPRTLATRLGNIFLFSERPEPALSRGV